MRRDFHPPQAKLVQSPQLNKNSEKALTFDKMSGANTIVSRFIVVQKTNSGALPHQKSPSNRLKDSWMEVIIVLLLGVSVFWVYRHSEGVIPMTDVVWTVPTSLSILNEGNVDLDEYHYAAGDGRLREVGGHWVSFFPNATAIVISPIVWIIAQISSLKGVDLYAHLKIEPDWDLVATLNQLIASIIAASTVVVIYLLARLSLSRGKAVLLAFLFAFGTSIWSTSSRDLWQHTVSTFLVALILLLILFQRKKDPGWLLFFIGLLTALAYWVRPTNSILVLFISLYVFMRYRGRAWIYLLGAGLLVIPFLIHNLSLYGNALPPYYQPGRLGSNAAWGEALAGNLISPSRGLLVYSPFLLFALYGLILKLREKHFGLLDSLLIGVVLLHWLAISSYHQWWGGASYGPRFMTDILPIGAYFLIPAIDEMTRREFWSFWPGRFLGALFILAAIWSVFVHARGSTQPATWAWNGSYPHVILRVDDAPNRVWDWSDPQFLRGLRPASLDVVPKTMCLAGVQGAGPLDEPTLTVLNRGDQPLDWQLTTPYRLTQRPAEAHVPGLGYSEIPLEIDAGGLEAGIHSLGGLYLTATGEDGRPARHSPQIIPVTLHLLADNEGAPTPSGGDCLATPPDIHITSQDERIWGIFGPGWYDRESYEEMNWRWATSPAQIFIFSPDRHTLTLTTTPISFHDPHAPNGFGENGSLHFTLNDQHLAEIDLHAGRPFSIDLPLSPGWNTLTLTSPAGNLRPIDIDPATGDARLLGFSLSDITFHD